MTTLRRSWLLALVGLALAVSIAQASAPSVSVTLTGPDEGWYDEDLGFSASGSFNLDGDTQKECQDGQASVSDQYSWSYSPAALVSGGGAHDSYVTVRYSQQQAGQTYTVSVTYTVTITYKDGTSDSGSATASKDVFIKGAQLSVSSNKSVICAGGIATPVHQALITVSVTGKDGQGLAGKTISLSATHEYNHIAPELSPTSVTTGGDGKAQATLTSGDGVVAGVVEARFGDHVAQSSVDFGEPDKELEFLDPVTGQPIDCLYADGESQCKVLLTMTFGGAPVDGHAIDWTFRFWNAEGDPLTDPAAYEGTGASRIMSQT